ncbi:unnamed protein product, partial [marine sediment metagenome]
DIVDPFSEALLEMAPGSDTPPHEPDAARETSPRVPPMYLWVQIVYHHNLMPPRQCANQSPSYESSSSRNENPRHITSLLGGLSLLLERYK